MPQSNAPTSPSTIAMRFTRAMLLVCAWSLSSPASAASQQDHAPPSRPTPIPSKERFEGAATERIEAGSYTYLRVRRDGSGDHVWVVTMGRSPKAGERVSITSFGEQRDFYSRRLGRTFNQLLFATVAPSTVR